MFRGEMRNDEREWDALTQEESSVLHNNHRPASNQKVRQIAKARDQLNRDLPAGNFNQHPATPATAASG